MPVPPDFLANQIPSDWKKIRDIFFQTPLDKEGQRLYTRDMASELLSTEELSQVLSLHTRTIKRYRDLGMPFIRLSSQAVRFDIDAVMEWFRKRNEEEA